MNTAYNQQSQQNHRKYLDNLPPGATRVAILVGGKRKWVAITDLKPTDFLVINAKKQRPFFMMGQPGRKKVIKTKPANPLVGALKKEKDLQVTDDPILVAVTDNPGSEDVMTLILRGLAEEIACLKFEREKAELEGNKSVGISDRRIKALKTMGDTWLKRMDQVQNRQIDMSSTTFRLLFEFIMQTFREGMAKSGVKNELIDVVFANIAKRLDGGWENEASAVMQKK